MDEQKQLRIATRFKDAMSDKAVELLPYLDDLSLAPHLLKIFHFIPFTSRSRKGSLDCFNVRFRKLFNFRNLGIPGCHKTLQRLANVVFLLLKHLSGLVQPEKVKKETKMEVDDEDNESEVVDKTTTC